MHGCHIELRFRLHMLDPSCVEMYFIPCALLSTGHNMQAHRAAAPHCCPASPTSLGPNHLKTTQAPYPPVICPNLQVVVATSHELVTLCVEELAAQHKVLVGGAATDGLTSRNIPQHLQQQKALSVLQKLTPACWDTSPFWPAPEVSCSC